MSAEIYIPKEMESLSWKSVKELGRWVVRRALGIEEPKITSPALPYPAHLNVSEWRTTPLAPTSSEFKAQNVSRVEAPTALDNGYVIGGEAPKAIKKAVNPAGGVITGAVDVHSQAAPVGNVIGMSREESERSAHWQPKSEEQSGDTSDQSASQITGVNQDIAK